MNTIMLPRGYRKTESLQNKLRNDRELLWKRRGERRALRLFHEMAQRVPAYKEFLKAKNFSPNSVKTIKDFKNIPTIDKDNYLRSYPKEMLCWDGKFSTNQWVISTTSGSSGKPYYFPREETQEWQYAVCAEQYLRTNFDIQNKTTLYIIAFPMGAWIGGVFTYEALKIVADKEDYSLSVVTAGISKQEVINAVKQLGDNFDQVIIGSYAPFLKDILDDGAREGVNWQNYNLGFIFSAEAFSETFRDYVARITGAKDIYTFSLNHYGTVDLGTMAHETPESVLVRRLLVSKHNLKLLFPERDRQPTFCQYNPELFYFEEVNDNLLCSAYSGLPLVRYDLKDYGGILSRKEVFSTLNSHGIDLNYELKQAGINTKTWDIPYLYVYERNDFSVSYYAFLIYPDMIRRVLQLPELEAIVTGKFTMLVEYDKDGRQKLIINIEKIHGLKHSNSNLEQLEDHLHEGLLTQSSEYAETFKTIGEPAKPAVILWDYEDPQYFKSGGKQKWVLK